MTMAKNNYWLKREQKWIKERQQSDAKYVEQMTKQYKVLQDNLEHQIKQFYATYASDTGMSMKDAVKAVKSFDVKSFESTAKKMVEQKDFSPYANDRLKIYNATMKINRLEYLKSQVGQELTEFTNEQEQQFYGNLKQSYLDELDRQSGILGRHANVQVKSNMDTIINASFHGAAWSQRLWVAQDELKAKLDTLLTRSMIRGINPKQLVQYVRSNISKEIKNSTAVAERLMITETARVQDQLQTELFKKNGVEYVKWVAEPTACDICLEIAAENDGVYKVDKVPEIPEHPRCKCSKSAWFGEVKKETSSDKIPNDIAEPTEIRPLEDFADRIKVTGIKPDVLEEVQKAFTKNFDNMEIPKIGKIEAVTERSTMGKMVFQGGGIASYGYSSDTMYLNKTQLSSMKKLNKTLEEQKQATEYILKQRENLTGEQRKLADQLVKSGRENVDPSVEGIISHELGHSLHYHDFARNHKELNQKIMGGNWKDYAEDLSLYANENYAEFFAESYTAYMSNEREKVIPDLLKYFDSIRKN
jgi:phage putative head morphogenesis protein, SPP1 gp7 family